MKKLLVVVLVLVVAVGALGYWRGWFSTTKVDPAKFKQDKAAFTKTVGEKTKGLKDKIASLWTKSKDLPAEKQAQVKKDLEELDKQHDQLVKQLAEAEEAGEDQFEGVKQKLEKELAVVDKKIEALTKELEKGKDK